MRLDLDRPRVFGELVSTTFALFWQHLAVFLSLTLMVVAPFVIAVDGVWGGALAHAGKVESTTSAATLASSALAVLIIPPLVTALHVAVVLGLGRGEEPTVADALRRAGPRLLPAVAAVALYTVGVAVGFLLLIVPGVWLLVRWYFAAQAVVVDGLSPPAALRRSAELVKGLWWRTFGVLLGFGLMAAVLGGLGNAIVSQIHTGWLYVTGEIVVRAVVLSLSAIFGTLLFFDCRARAGVRSTPTAPVDPLAPERPGPPPGI
ncbi:MAG: hypothetical protein QOC78_1319 [Solirubrobacteraceae bacterium]|nr:hypothetical protein [Solirubrobacteraceae bacterium]